MEAFSLEESFTSNNWKEGSSPYLQDLEVFIASTRKRHQPL